MEQAKEKLAVGLNNDHVIVWACVMLKWVIYCLCWRGHGSVWCGMHMWLVGCLHGRSLPSGCFAVVVQMLGCSLLFPPQCHHSTHYPPHEQLLMWLEMGGAVVPIVSFSSSTCAPAPLLIILFPIVSPPCFVPTHPSLSALSFSHYRTPYSLCE